MPWEVWDGLGARVEEDAIAFTWGDAETRKLRTEASKGQWKPAGTASHPFWPEVPSSLPETVYITAGESDCGTLRGVGLVAFAVTKGETSVPSRDALQRLYASGVRQAIVIFDADSPGRQGAGKFAPALRAEGIDAVVVDPAECKLTDPLLGEKDLNDAWRRHHRNGGTPGEFAARVRDAVEHTAAGPRPLPAVPDSRPLVNQESRITEAGPLRVWEMAEPAPRTWFIPELLPEGATTILYGDGGQGKSLLSLYLAACVAMGIPFLGRKTVQAPVLYVDAELDADEFVRRAYRVARGLEVDRPPQGLYYMRLTGSLAQPTVQSEIKAAVVACGARLIVLDSLTIASFGSDVKEADNVTAIMKALERLGTVLAIDHIRQPQPGANQSDYNPFGSVFKRNLARSVIQVIAATGGGITLRSGQEKGKRIKPPP